MSIAVNEIRPFWMPGLNEIVGQQKYSFVKWLLKQEYYIYSPISQYQFILDLRSNNNVNNMLSAFAFDCNRMASAAFETMCFIQQSKKLPKSTAWLIIKLYYAAFFSAHAIIRMLGISCSQLDRQQVNKIHEIAKLFGNDNGLNISSSYYSCVYNQNKTQLSFDNIKSKGGTHESFWKIFCDKIQDISNEVLSSGKIARQSQQVSIKLNELYGILRYQGHNGGNWLSSVRNKINYRHESNAWFPYRKTKQQNVEQIYRYCLTWLNDPMEINLVIKPSKPIDMFISACNFIVGLCRVLVQDMSDRCSKGKSYLKYGSLRLLNSMY